MVIIAICINYLFIKIDCCFVQVRREYVYICDNVTDIIHVILFVVILKFIVTAEEIALYMLWLYEYYLGSILMALHHDDLYTRRSQKALNGYLQFLLFPGIEKLTDILLQYEVVKWSYDLINSTLVVMDDCKRCGV